MRECTQPTTDERIELPPSGHALFSRQWLRQGAATRLLDELLQGIQWQQPDIKLFGRTMPIPRMQAWIGDEGAKYRYSGIDLEPAPWPRSLRPVRDALERKLQVPFNSVLANLYRDGTDCMHWHADDEPALGDNPTIASLSLGAARDFRLRRRDRQSEAVTVTLGNGDLLSMLGEVQTHWQHALPRRKGVTAPRVNLTFRRIIQ